MLHWWDIRGWSLRDSLMLLVALVLTLFVGFLVHANHGATLRLRASVASQARSDTEQHALVLEHFFEEQLGSLGDIAASPELVAYFENRAMGMSAEYGLRQSLLIIRERLDVLRKRKRLGEIPVLTRITLHDADGRILVASPSLPGDAGRSDPPRLGTALSADRRSVRLGAPVSFRGTEAGRVEAAVDLLLLRRLLGPEADSDRNASLILDRTDGSTLVGDGTMRDLPAAIRPMLPREDGRTMATYDDDEHHHLVVTVPVAGTGLLVASIRGSDRFLGSEPWHVLVLMVVLSTALLGGSVALVLHMVRSRMLGARVTELEVQGRIASARNREDLGREIHARKRAEEQRAQLGYAVEQAAEAIVITDAAGTIEYVNPAFTAITGWSREEAVGKSTRVLKSGFHDKAFYEALWSDLATGRSWSGRFVNRHRDGSLIYEDATISPVRDESGRIIRYVAVKRDVTALIRLEDQLRQAQKLESIGQLAAGIAHEINTPIQFIGDNLRFLSGGIQELGGTVSTLQRLVHDGADTAAIGLAIESSDLPYLGAELPKAVAQSLEGVERVAEIVRAMKDFSHPGSSTVSPCDLNRAIESTVTVSRNEWKLVAEVELQLDPHLPPVPLLLADFNQVILNLVVNAAHAIGDRPPRQGGEDHPGRIVVSTVRGLDTVLIRVTDNGCGIPEMIKPRIFEPFFTTKEVGRGTGQGLSTARNLITKKLHGTIDFESTEGVGTTFTITLPL